MENASKALLIAGAVLLVIAIIAIGMGIFGTARGVVNQAEGQIDNMSIQMHNKQFEEFEGGSLTYPEVKELISVILNNNANNDDYKVEIILKNSTGGSVLLTYKGNNYDYYSAQMQVWLDSIKSAGKGKVNLKYHKYATPEKV